MARPADSRRFVDDILGELAGRRYGLRAWMDFLGRSLERSFEQVRNRPAAAAEVTGLHALAALVGRRPWALVSWWLCITHLGLLGERQTLGWPNRLTVLRGLLPAMAPDSRWTALAAMAADFADGHLAQEGRESAFGAFADPIADGVFWSWFALRWERNPYFRWAPLALFAATAGSIGTVYFVRGHTIDYPRPNLIRYASAATQILLTIRAWRAGRR